MPQGQPGVSVQASGEIKIERTPSALDYNGCPFETLSIQTTLKFVANAEAKGAKPGGQLQAYLGQATKYQITVTPATPTRSTTAPPAAEPRRPTSLARGESIQLNEDYYAGIKAKGTYRELQVEMGYDAGRRVSSGVRRIDANKVRVMVGDEDFVRQALKFGVRIGDASVSLGNTKDLSDGKLHAVDIDISTEAGWNASSSSSRRAGCRSRARPARAPDEGRDGPLHGHDRDRGQARRAHDRRAAGLLRGPLDRDAQRRRQTERVTHIRYNHTSFAISEHRERRRQPRRRPAYSLMLHGVDDS